MRIHNIPFLIVKKKIIPNLQLWDLFQGSQKRDRNSRGKRAISVRAIEVLLYMTMSIYYGMSSHVCKDQNVNKEHVPFLVLIIIYRL